MAVAGYMLTAVGRVHQLFPVLEILRPASITGLLAIVLYLGDHSEVRRARVVVFPATRCLLWFLFWMVLSLPGALVAGTTFDLLFSNFIKTVLMYFIVAGSVRSVRDVERLATVYLIGATVYSAVVISRFDLGSGDAWRLGRLYYYDANDLATFAVTAMPFGLYLLHAGRRSLTRAFGALALIVLTLAFVRTGSRGGFIALIAVAGFVVLRYSAVAFRWRLAATALLAVVVVGTASDQYWKQMGTIMSDADYNRTDESGRMKIWARGVGYMMSNPLLGVGGGNFPAAEGMLSPFAVRQQLGVGVRWNAAHNSYIQVGAELGIPGLVLFIGIIVGAFRALRASNRYATDEAEPEDSRRALTRALTASLIGFVVGAYFLSLAYAEILYTLVAMAVGLQKVTAAENSALDGDAPSPSST